MPKIDLGEIRGPKGDPGPNEVSAGTPSAITGLLKGSDGKVAQAVAGTDYLPCEDPVFSGALATSDLKVSIKSDGGAGIVGAYGPHGLVGAFESADGGLAPEGISLVHSGEGNRICVKTAGAEGAIDAVPGGDGGVVLSGIAAPAGGSDAANKDYVDASIRAAIEDTWEASY